LEPGTGSLSFLSVVLWHLSPAQQCGTVQILVTETRDRGGTVRKWSLILLLLAASLFGVPPAVAHVQLSNGAGTWTFLYFTRDEGATSDCLNQTGSTDPTNLIARWWGAQPHMEGHLHEGSYGAVDFPWDQFSGLSSQSICGRASDGDYDVLSDQAAESDGQTDWGLKKREHYRSFKSPHTHSDDVEKWTVYDIHHEHLVVSYLPPGVDHVIDSSWEYHEELMISDFQGRGDHDAVNDAYDHHPPGSPQDYWDNGMTSRIGGLHDGIY
jgi:hypothetical protein